MVVAVRGGTSKGGQGNGGAGKGFSGASVAVLWNDGPLVTSTWFERCILDLSLAVDCKTL